MEIAVLDINGKETGTKVKLNPEVFGIEPSQHVIYLAMKHYLASQRQGTHKTKERGEVAGSTRKLHKQKGTGGSRKGDIKNPLFRGGGKIFGPRPRDYRFKLNKSLKRLAKKSVLSLKANEKAITALDISDFKEIKTKSFVEMQKSLDLFNKKCLFVLPESNKDVYLSSRNLQKVKVVTVSELNSYDIFNAQQLVLVSDSIAKIEESLIKK